MDQPPLSFRALAQSAGNPATGGYPYALRGDDLDKCFLAATAIYDAEHFKNTDSPGLGGHLQPKVSIKNPLPDPPANGFQLLGGGNNGYSFLTGQKAGALITWVKGLTAGEEGGWTTVSPQENGQIPFFYKPTNGSTQQWSFLSPKDEGQLFYWDETAGRWKSISPKVDGQIPQWDNENKLWKFIGTPTREGQLLKWDDDSKTWTPFSGGAEGSFPQWDAENGWESMGSGTARGQLLRWDADSKNWGPVSGSPGALLQWDATEGWQADIGGSSNGQLLNFNNETKKWQTFTPGENSIMYYRNNAWTILTPPATGTYVLGAKEGVMQWIATEEC
jgi:hypothetical protein